MLDTPFVPTHVLCLQRSAVTAFLKRHNSNKQMLDRIGFDSFNVMRVGECYKLSNQYKYHDGSTMTISDYEFRNYFSVNEIPVGTKIPKPEFGVEILVRIKDVTLTKDTWKEFCKNIEKTFVG